MKEFNEVYYELKLLPSLAPDERFIFRPRSDINAFSIRLRDGMLPIKILEMDTYCHSLEKPPIEKQDELIAAIQHFINIC
ncbi:MAG: hypothetical protein L6M37_01625 [Candidatus Methylarchaceae archaeon HK02M1]|nr:hypothetical protein [Candidatus Methylarchaceae archaeon HK02M1]